MPVLGSRKTSLQRLCDRRIRSSKSMFVILRRRLKQRGYA